MIEAKANIRGRRCSISPKGRITVEAGPDSAKEPPFTASMSELDTLTLLAQGLTFDEVSLETGLTQYSARQQVEKLRSRNEFRRTFELVAIATRLGLLNRHAKRGIYILSGGPIKGYGK